MSFEQIPQALKSLPNWVIWQTQDKRKMPLRVDTREPASSTNPRDWTTYEKAVECIQQNSFAGYGLGFVFFEGGGLCGIDLDGCRNPETGYMTDWAMRLLDQFDSYSEVSPSGTGVKIFIKATKPDTARSVYKIAPGSETKKAEAVEIYDSGRYFTVTGESIGQLDNIESRQDELDDLCKKLWPVTRTAPLPADREHMPPLVNRMQLQSGHLSGVDLVNRASLYVDKIPSVGQGERDHQFFKIAIILIRGFTLSKEQATPILAAYNARCMPPWPSTDNHRLLRKLDQAADASHVGFGWLVNKPIDQFDGQVDFSQTLPPGYQAKQIEIPKLDIESLSELAEKYPEMRPVIVDNICREGEIVNIIASPKMGKSWLCLDLAISIATGKKWFDYFGTRKGRVLYVDNELHKETIANRLAKVAFAKEVSLDELEHGLKVISLRDTPRSLAELSASLRELISPSEFDIIVLDAFYRFNVDVDENSNSDMAGQYNILNKMADLVGASLIVVHHASKGSQSDKSVIDVGSGAGAISRAADSHLVIRDHETDGLSVFSIRSRSFPPTDDQTVEFNFPCWQWRDVEPVLKSASKADKKKDEAKELSELIDRFWKFWPENDEFTRTKFKQTAACSYGKADKCIALMQETGRIRTTGEKEYMGRMYRVFAANNSQM